jgi:hypothetical protein
MIGIVPSREPPSPPAPLPRERGARVSGLEERVTKIQSPSPQGEGFRVRAVRQSLSHLSEFLHVIHRRIHNSPLRLPQCAVSRFNDFHRSQSILRRNQQLLFTANRTGKVIDLTGEGLDFVVAMAEGNPILA